MNTKDLSRIAIVIRMKLQNTVGKKITTLAGIRRKFTLISHIAHLLLIRKFYCFSPGPHISFKYVRHNHLRFPMMGVVSIVRKRVPASPSF